MTEPFDPDILRAQLAASDARAIAAEKAMTRLAEDARLLLEPMLTLPAGIFVRRPWLFRPVFGALVEAVRGSR